MLLFRYHKKVLSGLMQGNIGYSEHRGLGVGQVWLVLIGIQFGEQLTTFVLGGTCTK